MATINLPDAQATAAAEGGLYLPARVCLEGVPSVTALVGPPGG